MKQQKIFVVEGLSKVRNTQITEEKKRMRDTSIGTYVSRYINERKESHVKNLRKTVRGIIQESGHEES